MYKINVIGAGYWGPNLIRCFNDIPDVCVGYVVDPNRKRLEQLKSRFKNIETSDNITLAATDPKAQAVVIATPASLHYEIAKEAILAGKHVFIEKPICIKASQSEELLALAKQSKVTLMVGHIFLYNAAINKVKEFILSEEIGKILYIDAVRTNLGPVRFDVNALWDLASHDISIFQYWLEDMPEAVSATGRKVLGSDMEDVTFATLKYKNGIIAHIHTSWLNPQKVRQITIVGDKKMIVWDDVNLTQSVVLYDRHINVDKNRISDSFASHRLAYHFGNITIPPISGEEPLKVECSHFIDSIKESKKPLTDGKFGTDVVKILEAAEKSLKSDGLYQKVER